MRNLKLTKLVGIAAFGLMAILGTSVSADAQYSRSQQKQIKKITKAQQKIAEQRAKEEQARIRLMQQQQDQRQNGNWNNNNARRYRVIRGGRTYTTDNRGAELLRQAVNQGYQQGFNAGQNDRSNRRRMSYRTNSMYRTGTYGYQTHVDRSQYQYYFQQGFQKGYDDGFNSRNRYGTNNGGSISILGNILGAILNIQSN